MAERRGRARTSRVAIVMGSESDRPAMEEAARVLAEFGVGCEVAVRSAHRSPEATARWAREARGRGVRVIIAGAGGAAHLAGAVAANTRLPVLGVPLATSPLGGFDALLATVQMPPGVPVGTLGVGAWGVKNAAHLALRVLALEDASLARRLEQQALELARRGAGAVDTRGIPTRAGGNGRGRRPRTGGG
ncbi:MAG TPA: 5-(carboxyamino)imidazole ribonucleotide mutase [Terriglobales bacterium]|nr:5-(carboxyamino)imidazole ribonucleotide mutase [Terriglobales bacterium]